MKKATFLTLAAAAALLVTTAGSKAAVVYSDLSTTGLNTSTTTAPTALDDITFSLGATNVRQQLSAMTFGVGVLPGTTAQTAAVFVDFYDTVNVASTGSVVSDYLGGFGGTLNITANTGTTTALRSFSFSTLATLATPIYFTDNNIGIVITLTDSTGQFYSSVLTPLMTLGAPTVGSSVLGVYRDANNDGTFQSTEFNAAVGNLYLSLTTINAVPEPSTYAAMGIGALALGTVIVRRNRRNA